MNKITWNDFLKIPNILSIFRIVLIPIFLYMVFLLGFEDGKYIIFSILFLSWLTDIFDWIAARKLNMITELGKILDPLADKATQISILFALWIDHLVPGWIFGVIFIKELLLLIGAVYLKKVIKKNIIPSNYWGKSATGFFYISTALLIFEAPFAIYGIYITAILMLIAFATYGKIVYSLTQKKIWAIRKSP